MASLDDLPLNSPEEPGEPAPSSPPPDTKPWWPWLAGLVALLVVAGGAVMLWRLWVRPLPSPASTAARPAAALPVARVPLGPSVPAVELPALDLTDPLVRELLARLSSSPEVGAWLATDGLIRNFVVSVENVAEGRSPARHLRRLAPASGFRVTVRGGALAIDSRSYDRYNGLADAVASFDAAGLARLYATLKPRLAEAYKELGHPEGDIDAAVERAVAHLLETPAIAGDVPLVAPTVSYRFADPNLESVSPAQKQLLRMGPRNRQIILDKLQELAAVLGIHGQPKTTRNAR
jgi:hypothetical protein